MNIDLFEGLPREVYDTSLSRSRQEKKGNQIIRQSIYACARQRAILVTSALEQWLKSMLAEPGLYQYNFVTETKRLRRNQRKLEAQAAAGDAEADIMLHRRSKIIPPDNPRNGS